MLRWHRGTWLFLAGSMLIWLILFGRFLIGQSCFGYRDTAHLYYPLFKWIQGQWNQGEVPLWNPLDDFGQPVIADGVSSVFYPLKAIFFLTVLPFPIRFGLFVSVHFLIAAWGTYFFGRTLRLSPPASALAASAFAMSGAFLFQTNNVIYFVGAAWLPWAWAYGWSALRRAQPRHLLGCAVCIALMILGGDPQSAYHVLLVLGAYAFWKALRRPKVIQRSVWLAPICKFGLIGLIAAGLSAVQLFPSWEWQQRSVRANPEMPRSIWESTSNFLAGRGFHAEAWFQNPPPDSHHDHVYQFSQPPWSIAELVWPNVSGKEFPVFRRWTAVIPAADRVWTPSLYLGAVTFLLAVCGARFWGHSRVVVGLTWLTIVFGMGSLGWYGLGWLGREIGTTLQFDGQSKVPAPLFGVYWWITTLLPGYALFRYPAKLFVVATLGISLLAGVNFDRLKPSQAPLIRRMSAGVFFVSLALPLISFWPAATVGLTRIPADPSFGPFDAAGALCDLRIAFVHSAVVTGLLWLLLREQNFATRLNPRASGWIVALVVTDLVVANAWLVVGVPAEAFTARLDSARVKPDSREQGLVRFRRSDWTEAEPAAWSTTSSTDRLRELIEFQRETLFPKFHLSQNVGLIGSFHAIEPLDLKWFHEFANAQLDSFVAETQRTYFLTDWKPHRLSQVTKLHAERKKEFKAMIQGDLSKIAAINHATNSRPSTAPSIAIQRNGVTSSAIEVDSANRVTIHVQCPTAGWLILKDYWDAGWIVEVSNRQTGIRARSRADRFCGIFRAVSLPSAGEFDVRFSYRPHSLYWGAFVSVATLITICAVIVLGGTARH